MDRGPYMMTRSGTKFYFLDPRPEDIVLEDIAHSLAMQPRYNGHTDNHYSIAQHSVNVAERVARMRTDSFGDSKVVVLQGLLHDAAEAYTGDIVQPLKILLGSTFYDIEHSIERALFQRFSLGQYPADPIVKRADIVEFEQEMLQLAPFRRECAPEFEYRKLSAEAAKVLFLNKFKELT
jgi:uncharacterized protein